MRDCIISLAELPFIRQKLADEGSLRPLDQVEELRYFEERDVYDALGYAYFMALDVQTELFQLVHILEESQNEVDVVSLLKAMALEQEWLMKEIDIALGRDEPDHDRAARQAAALAPLMPGIAGVQDKYFGGFIREIRKQCAGSQAETTGTAPGTETDHGIAGASES